MKRTWLWVTIIVLVLAAAIAAIWYFMRPQAATVFSCDENLPVVIYNMTNFNEGHSNESQACLDLGDYGPAQLGVMNNVASSIKVKPGFKATVFNQTDYKGRSLEINTDLKDLDVVRGGGEEDWDNKIASIRVEKTEKPCGVAVYNEFDYKGYGKCLPVGSHGDGTGGTINSLIGENGIVSLFKNISSIKVFPGFEAIFYGRNDSGDGDNFPIYNHGTSVLEHPDLRKVLLNTDQKQNWDNRITSIGILAARVAGDGLSCDTVAISADANFSGTSKCLPAGTYTNEVLKSYGLGDKSISSIKVRPGYLARIFANDNLGGSGQSLTTSSATLNDLPSPGSPWNDKTMSMQVVKISDCPAIIFGIKQFSGFSLCLEAGEYDNNALVEKVGSDLVGINNPAKDSISSIIINNGHRATLYKNANLSGDSLEVTASIPDLAENNFDDTAFSIRVSSCERMSRGDLDCNGTVNAVDLSVIRANFLRD